MSTLFQPVERVEEHAPQPLPRLFQMPADGRFVNAKLLCRLPRGKALKETELYALALAVGELALHGAAQCMQHAAVFRICRFPLAKVLLNPGKALCELVKG